MQQKEKGERTIKKLSYSVFIKTDMGGGFSELAEFPFTSLKQARDKAEWLLSLGAADVRVMHQVELGRQGPSGRHQASKNNPQVPKEGKSNV